MTYYILGAGPTGMAVVDGLIDAGSGSIVLFEKDQQLGGFAKTLQWNEVGAHDLGPHKIFTLDQTLLSRVEALIPPSDWLTRSKMSRIFLKDHFLPYPPSPFSLASVFGLSAFIRMVAGYGLAKLSHLFKTTKPSTYEEDLIGRMGKPLYEILFKPITEKLWGDPSQLDVALSTGRVQTPSLGEIVGRMLKIKKGSEFEALTFRYPRGGLSKLWKAVEEKLFGFGEVKRGYTITGLETTNDYISKIVYSADGKTGSINVKPDDFVISTLPLTYTSQILSHAFSTEFQKLTKQVVVQNDLLLVFFHIDRKSLLDESWVFIPDPGIAFHRLSEQESFDPDMTPHGSIVCCEIMSSVHRPMAEKTDMELMELALQGLAVMGYHGFNILHKRVIRLPQSYPVFATGYRPKLVALMDRLDQFVNFRSIGRQGAYNYIGTLDAMDIGYGLSQWLSTGKRSDWRVERERTSNYPVLD